jgi:hypothetical protein
MSLGKKLPVPERAIQAPQGTNTWKIVGKLDVISEISMEYEGSMAMSTNPQRLWQITIGLHCSAFQFL